MNPQEEGRPTGQTAPSDGGAGSQEASSATTSDKTVEALRAESEKNEQAAREAQDRYLRTLADFENYRKRAQREQVDQARYGNEKLIRELLPAIDNLDRAIAHSRETRDFDRMMEGVALTQKLLLSVLGKFGVTPIESLHQSFDPALHQSIGQVEVDEGSDAKENQVVGETQKGYLINERVLRPSLVTIAKRKTPSSGSD
ncbi:MAG: nucleotide exchange factor GrpE [Nitrospirae bacterium]|nr:nucleotide exchange factor GrpE [Candidatus Manganitrophaceae bacterium]